MLIFSVFLVVFFVPLSFAQNHPNRVVIERITSLSFHYPIRMGIIGDNYGINSNFIKLLERISLLDPPVDFVVHTGDFARGGGEDGYTDYLTTIDTLPFPIITVIGNHELDISGGLERYITYFGLPDFYFDWGDFRFIVMEDCYPSTTPDRFGDYSDYYISEAQLDWLDRLLRDREPRFKLIFMHMPPFIEGHIGVACLGGFGQEPQRSESGTDRFTELCRDYRVLLVGLGHIHVYDVYQPNNERYGSVIYLISGGGGAELSPWLYPAPYGGSFFHFVLVELFEDGVVSGKVYRMEGDSVFYDPAYDFRFSQTSVDEQLLISRKPIIEIYPNPSNISFVVRIQGGNIGGRIDLIDMTGKTVFSYLLSVDKLREIKIDCIGLKSGLYFLRFKGDGVTRIRKVVVLK